VFVLSRYSCTFHDLASGPVYSQGMFKGQLAISSLEKTNLNILHKDGASVLLSVQSFFTLSKHLQTSVFAAKVCELNFCKLQLIFVV
jgi:hypothetical protein